MDLINALIFVGAILLVVTILTSLISFRLGAPLLLVFLLVGLFAGVDGIGGIEFDSAPAAFLIGSVALALILFDSGFQTRWSSYRAAAWPAVTLATVGVVLTTAILAVAARYVLHLTWLEALLLSSLISSTDAAAVFFLLRVGGITLRDRVRSTLEIESGSNDPMAIFLAIGLVELIRLNAGDGALADLARMFAIQIGGGAALGVFGGYAIAFIVNRVRLDAGLHPVVVLALGLLVFAATNVAGGSGFLAAYLAGLVAGNTRLQGGESLRRFQSGLTWLSQIIMFVTLGLLATPSQFPSLVLPSLALAIVLTVLARPIAVWLCLLPFGFSRQETAFIAWVGLRGAVSILLALVPVLGGLPNSQMFFNIAFLMVLISLTVQGWTVRPAARWLGLIVPQRQGPVERVELELPGLADHELVGYAIRDGSPVAHGQRLPRWARPALIRRDGVVLSAHAARQLQVGDLVYVFASPSQVPLLDRLFGGTKPIADDDRAFYGDFVLSPDARLGSIAELYGLPLDVRRADRSLRELFHENFRHGVEIGDRLGVGAVQLVVRDMRDNEITAIGLALDPDEKALPHIPFFQRPHEIAAGCRRQGRRLWRRLRRGKS